MKIKIITLSIIISLVGILSCNNSKTEKKESVIEQEVWKISKIEADSIIKLVADSLQISLSKAISEGGFVHAIEFCSVNALPITSSFNDAGISISRKAVKFRNPVNKPDSIGEAVFNEFAILEGHEIGSASKYIETLQEIRYYKPIILLPHCRHCHGKIGSEISSELADVITKKYPNDLAIGFTNLELRGVWEIIQKLK